MNINTRIKEEYKGMPVYEYSLENNNGYKVNILSIGATVSEIYMPDKDGVFGNILMSYPTVADLERSVSYSGCTLAPNAGRISSSTLKIDDKIYNLSKNNGDNNLHGGFDCVSFNNWNLDEEITDDSFVSIKLSYTIPDGTDGFPGNRDIAALFTLDNDNILTIEYFAKTDTATYLNLSNHMSKTKPNNPVNIPEI